MVQLDNISLAFGGQTIFDRLTWFIGDDVRAGLVGPNGAGKTTLLRLISGSLRPDEGDVSIRKGTTIGYLQQEILEDENQDLNVIDYVLRSFGKLSDLEQQETDLLDRLDTDGSDPDETRQLLRKLETIHASMEALDAHRLEHEAEAVLSGLGFSAEELTRNVVSFSGGWRMRMALASLLLRKPDLLLLDEPTNHLDIETIDWFEDHLANYAGSVVLVSHDRYFLDRMVSVTAELTRGRIIEYSGNYQKYLEERQLRREHQQAAYENQQREIRQAEQFIRRFRAKASKAKQAQSRIKMLERLDRIEPPEPEEASIRFSFPEGDKPGRVVLELSRFSKTYEVDEGADVVVFDNADPLVIERNEHIALVGRNGAGKSTLARILRGTEPFEGERSVGLRVKMGFFAQSQTEALDGTRTVLTTLREAAYGWDETTIRGLLGAFLFSGDDVEKKVEVLSGGERSRLALALTLVTPANLLILDEPTNHLDIRSRQALVQALKQFPGTFVVISHDRHFLDQIATKVWYVAGGGVKEYVGTYSQIRLPSPKPLEPDTEVANTDQSSTGSSGGPKSKEQKRREAQLRNRLAHARRKLEDSLLSQNEPDLSSIDPELTDHALRVLETEIEKHENEKASLEERLADPDFYSDTNRSSVVVQRFSELEAAIRQLMSRWEAIASRDA